MQRTASTPTLLLDSGRKWYLQSSRFAYLGNPTKTVHFRRDSKPIPLQDLSPQTIYSDGLIKPNAKSSSITSKIEEYSVVNHVTHENPYFVLRDFSYEIIRITMARNGFKRIATEDSDWNILWGRYISPQLLKQMNVFQKVNHFPGSYNLGRKDCLHINLHKMKQLYGEKEYHFFPNCYLLPYDKEFFALEKDPNKLFIQKPFAASCGRGISVVRAGDPTIGSKGPCLVQEYIDNPLLINGHKFDMRLYVAVTSVDPLRIYLFEDGLVRFATKPYSNDTIDTTLAHLTNFSLNKKSKDFVANTNAESDNEGHKWSVLALKKYMEENNINHNKIWKDVEEVIVKTMLGVEDLYHFKMQQSETVSSNACFEFYGFDIMLDANLKPWLIEVNLCPALHCGSPLDKKIKGNALSDLFNMIGIVPYNRMNYEYEENRLTKFIKPGQGTFSKEEKFSLQQGEDELYKSRGYKRIFPPVDDVDYWDKYGHLFTREKRSNIVTREFEKMKSEMPLEKAYSELA